MAIYSKIFARDFAIRSKAPSNIDQIEKHIERYRSHSRGRTRFRSFEKAASRAGGSESGLDRAGIWSKRDRRQRRQVPRKRVVDPYTEYIRIRNTVVLPTRSARQPALHWTAADAAAYIAVGARARRDRAERSRGCRREARASRGQRESDSRFAAAFRADYDDTYVHRHAYMYAG